MSKFHLKEFINSLKGKHDLKESWVFFFFTFFITFRNKNIIHRDIGCFLREEIHTKIIQFHKSRKNRTSTEIQSYPWDYTVKENGI